MTFLIIASQFVNVIFGGSPYEMLSARAWRRSPFSKRWLTYQIIINTLFFWESDHCQKTHEAEIRRLANELGMRQ